MGAGELIGGRAARLPAAALHFAARAAGTGLVRPGPGTRASRSGEGERLIRPGQIRGGATARNTCLAVSRQSARRRASRPFIWTRALAMTEQFLTVEQIAEELQVTAQTIRNWIKAGALRPCDLAMSTASGARSSRR